MSLLENKPLAILVGINLIAFVVIFWLTGVIMVRDDAPSQVTVAPASPQQRQPIQQQSAPTGQQVTTQQNIVAETDIVETNTIETDAQTIKQQSKQDSLSDAIIKEVAANSAAPGNKEPTTIERTTAIDVFYNGDIVRIEKTDDEGNKSISISNNLKEVERLSEEDASYLADLKRMKAGEIGHMSMYKVTQEQAKSVTAVKSVESQNTQDKVNIDHFNKVDVSKSASTREQTIASLAQQIQALVNDAPDKKTNTKKPQHVAQNDYLQSLQTASSERKNETRTIKVKYGDSLWKLAVRAYGNGFKYTRIFKANPHIKDPDMIRVGEILRVPL